MLSAVVVIGALRVKRIFSHKNIYTLQHRPTNFRIGTKLIAYFLLFNPKAIIKIYSFVVLRTKSQFFDLFPYVHGLVNLSHMIQTSSFYDIQSPLIDVKVSL